MKTLRMKIIIPVLIVCVMGLAALSFSAYYLSSQMVEDGIENLAVTKVGQLKGAIDSKLELHMADISALARTEEVKSLNWDVIDQYIFDRIQYYGDYEEFLFADTYGFYSGTLGTSGSIGDMDYFQEALLGKNAISEPIISKDTDKQVFALASPVKNETGEVIAVLVGIYRADIISELIKGTRLGDEGYAYIINADGITLYHQDDKMRSSNVLTQENEDLVNLTQKMINGESDIGYYTYDGMEKLMAYTPLEVNGWSVAITTPKSYVTGELGKLRVNSILITLITILVIISSIYVIVNRLMKPCLFTHLRRRRCRQKS